MRRKLILLLVPAFFVAGMLILSCDGGRYLRTGEVAAPDLTGTYTLILYGGDYPENGMKVAFLDKEGDRYSFRIFSPEYKYTVTREVPGREALERAERFVRSHRSFESFRLSRIIDEEGDVVGYELRPLYAKSEYGFSDILSVYYIIRDNKIITKIGLRPELDKSFFEDRSLGL